VDIEVSNETILLVVKFRIGGSLRFLSHAETLRVFQRACVRAGIQIRHTQGFNPHPKLSLPLPRSVGVESDEELLCLRLIYDPSEPRAADYESRIMDVLSEQLPEGIELLSVSLAEPKTSFQPCSATYILKVRPEYLNGTLKSRIEQLLANKSLFVTRAFGHGSRGTPKRSARRKADKVREVDVRPFLKSIDLNDRNILVECNISSAGSIRIDEILELLELDVEKLAAPIKRTSVQWQKT